MSISKLFDRFFRNDNGELEANPNGNIFLKNKTQWNSDQVRVLHAGVDTVKQLYGGLIDQEVYQQIKDRFAVGYGQFIDLIGAGGERVPFMVSSGKKGGYRYTLLNQDLGFIILIGSVYAQENLNASHMKIELSPHLIHNHSVDELQKMMDGYAKQLMTQVQPVGVALHLCCDIQGFEVPNDLDRLLTTKTRRKTSISGISDFNLATNAAKYGANETFLFGRADQLQFCVYRKDIEAKVKDKMHFWGQIWGNACDSDLEPVYKDDEPVWRFEMRFHHTIIDELAREQDIEILSFSQAMSYIRGLWQYAMLKSYRLDLSKDMIHPAWQFMAESIHVRANEHAPIFTKRAKKKPGEGNQKNVCLAYGNLISIYARNRYPARYALRCLRESGIWRDLFRYFERKHGIFDDISMVSALIMRDVEQRLKIKTVGFGIAA
jgi:hypothetical protein